MLINQEISDILDHFGLNFRYVTSVYNTSHGENDIRLNYILDDRYVLKVNSAHVICEDRLQEISRLIARYRAIGIYCPAFIPTISGPLSYMWNRGDRVYTCYVEEYAIYPLFDQNSEYDRREVVEHLGILAAKYSGIDLSETKSMWSIIDLAPLDVNIDEKQENANMLAEALLKNGFPKTARELSVCNQALRHHILTVFPQLPRCVFQGDLNSTNELHQDGHFVGLIDFNLSGTDVNINVFLNETNWFPEEDEFDRMSIGEILSKMDTEQMDTLSAILRHYTLNDIEKFAFPYYKGIVDLFQYPDVCMMVKWLKEDSRRVKCASFIRAMIEKFTKQEVMRFES